MKLPPGLDLTEQQVVEVMMKVATLLGKRFAFGPHTADDVAQQVMVCCLEALPKYDAGKVKPGKTPGDRLQAFLFINAKRRLLNWKRSECFRSEVPCQQCHTGEFCTGEGEPCGHYRRWKARNEAKRSLCELESLPEVPGAVPGSSPNDAGNPLLGVEDDAAGKAAGKELASLIDERLPVELRADYLRMRDGVRVNEYRREMVQTAVARILTKAKLASPQSSQNEE